ncbi:unnamed protein product [Fusarium fujikuroi]|nr:unnamed protein product [Fusarium fujikuroi]
MVKLINHWYPGMTILEIVRPSRDLLRVPVIKFSHVTSYILLKIRIEAFQARWTSKTITNDMLRNAIIIGSLPGLWIGAESGRSYRPMLDLELCNILLKLCGFGGIETSITICNSIRAVAGDRVALLTDLLGTQPFIKIDAKVIARGKGKSQLRYKFSSLEHLRSIKSFRKTTLQPGLTILNLRDLYKPVIKSAIKAKIDRLKTLQI